MMEWGWNISHALQTWPKERKSWWQRSSEQRQLLQCADNHNTAFFLNDGGRQAVDRFNTALILPFPIFLFVRCIDVLLEKMHQSCDWIRDKGKVNKSNKKPWQHYLAAILRVFPSLFATILEPLIHPLEFFVFALVRACKAISTRDADLTTMQQAQHIFVTTILHVVKVGVVAVAILAVIGIIPVPAFSALITSFGAALNLPGILGPGSLIAAKALFVYGVAVVAGFMTQSIVAYKIVRKPKAKSRNGSASSDSNEGGFLLDDNFDSPSKASVSSSNTSPIKNPSRPGEQRPAGVVEHSVASPSSMPSNLQNLSPVFSYSSSDKESDTESDAEDDVVALVDDNQHSALEIGDAARERSDTNTSDVSNRSSSSRRRSRI